MRVEYRATTDKPTVLNPTQHSYFNLKGAGNGDVLNHRLQNFSDAINVTRRDFLTGTLAAGLAGGAGHRRDDDLQLLLGVAEHLLAIDQCQVGNRRRT